MPDLLASWCEAGQPAAAFWSITPRIFGHVMRGATAARAHADQRSLTAAWVTARLAVYSVNAPGKFPPLSDVVSTGRTAIKPRQTAEKMKATARLWLAAFGGQVKED